MNSNKTILLVDDDFQLRESLRLILELEGFRIVEADSGNRALELLETEEVDLILSDVRMPNGDGLELLKAIREQQKISVPVVLMTGFADVTERQAIEQGATDLVPKPFDLDRLRRALHVLY